MAIRRLIGVLTAITFLNGCAHGSFGLHYKGLSTENSLSQENERLKFDNRRLNDAVMLTYSFSLQKQQNKLDIKTTESEMRRVTENPDAKVPQTWVWLGVAALAALAVGGGGGGSKSSSSRTEDQKFLCSVPPTFELKPCDLGIR
jgi:hypothetical protein